MSPCPPGYVCNSGGASSQNELDNSTIRLCNEGTYCQGENSLEVKCPVNKYNPNKG